MTLVGMATVGLDDGSCAAAPTRAPAIAGRSIRDGCGINLTSYLGRARGRSRDPGDEVFERFAVGDEGVHDGACIRVAE
jgi:hypothetical protein